jgi:hypothetical protein
VAFIEVLEKSAEYIQDIATVQRVASATAPKSESTEVKLSNLFRSLELSEDDDDDDEALTAAIKGTSGIASPSTATFDASDTYMPKKVYRAQIDPASDYRFRRHCLLEQAATEMRYIQGLWDAHDRGELHTGMASFLTQAALELYGEGAKVLLQSASGATEISDVELDLRSPIDRAILSLKDIAAARKTHPVYTFPLAPLPQRHPEIESTPYAIGADRFLAQFVMELSLEMVSYDRSLRIPRGRH